MARKLGIGLAVLVALALAAFVASRASSVFSRTDSEEVADPDKTDGPAAEKAKPPQFESWPKPAAALVLTGEQHGYLEPCGCTEKQSGGVARRSDLFRQLRAKGWEVAGVDLGGVVARARKQTEFKFAAITEAMRKLGYRAMGLGPEDLRLQPAFLLGQHVPGDEESGLAFVSSNMTFFGVPDLEGGPKRFQVFEVGGVKVGVAMTLGESQQRGLFPEGSGAEVTFVPPAEALAEVVKELEAAGTRFNVLLSYADLDESKSLAEKFPQFGVVVSAGGPEDPVGKPVEVGTTRLVTVGHKGKYAGVLGVYPDDEKQPVRFELVNLDKDRFAHDKAMDAIMAEYQQTLRDNLSDVFADLPEGSPPGGGTYVGAAKCGECHKKAFAKWKETPHAKGYESLIAGRKGFEGTWVTRTHDPECLSCHVTGWEPQEVYPYASGFLPEEIAAEKNEPHRFALLRGQQCENCHGPGSEHVAVMERWTKDAKSVPRQEQASAAALMKVDMRTVEQKVCVRCHDGDNSPDWDFKTYWPKVAHPGRD